MEIHELFKLLGKLKQNDLNLPLVKELTGQNLADKHENKANSKITSHLKSLISANKSMLESVKFLLSRKDLLAACIGTCKTCWGSDDNCETCIGKGIPGYFEINYLAFKTIQKANIQELSNKKNLKY